MAFPCLVASISIFRPVKKPPLQLRHFMQNHEFGTGVSQSQNGLRPSQHPGPSPCRGHLPGASTQALCLCKAGISRPQASRLVAGVSTHHHASKAGYHARGRRRQAPPESTPDLTRCPLDHMHNAIICHTTLQQDLNGPNRSKQSPSLQLRFHKPSAASCFQISLRTAYRQTGITSCLPAAYY